MPEGNENTGTTTETTDAETVAAAVAPAKGAEGAQETTWNHAEGVPGQGEAPEWFKKEKYGTVAAQAEAYKALESQFGSFTGAPENYEVALSDELKEKGVEITSDDPIMEEAIKFAKESNMSQDGFNSMIELYAMTKLAETNAVEDFKTQEIAALGTNGQERLNNIDAWAKTNLPTDLYDGVIEMAVSANSVCALEKLIAMSRNAPVSAEEISAAPGGISEEEVRKMQFEKDDQGNRKIQTDPAFAAKFRKASQQVWGSEDHNIIIGAK